jgi:hypothetical protein
MVMVWPQAICDDRYSRGRGVLLEQTQKIIVIFFFEENRLAVAAAVIDLIEVACGKGHHARGHDTPPVVYVPGTAQVPGTYR